MKATLNRACHLEGVAHDKWRIAPRDIAYREKVMPDDGDAMIAVNDYSIAVVPASGGSHGHVTAKDFETARKARGRLLKNKSRQTTVTLKPEDGNFPPHWKEVVPNFSIQRRVSVAVDVRQLVALANALGSNDVVLTVGIPSHAYDRSDSDVAVQEPIFVQLLGDKEPASKSQGYGVLMPLHLRRVGGE